MLSQQNGNSPLMLRKTSVLLRYRLPATVNVCSLFVTQTYVQHVKCMTSYAESVTMMYLGDKDGGFSALFLVKRQHVFQGEVTDDIAAGMQQVVI